MLLRLSLVGMVGDRCEDGKTSGSGEFSSLIDELILGQAFATK